MGEMWAPFIIARFEVFKVSQPRRPCIFIIVPFARHTTTTTTTLIFLLNFFWQQYV